MSLNFSSSVFIFIKMQFYTCWNLFSAVNSEIFLKCYSFPSRDLITTAQYVLSLLRRVKRDSNKLASVKT